MTESFLYYITDRRAFPGTEPERRRHLLDKVAEATRAGIDYIQIREKDLSSRELEHLAREAVRIIAKVRTDNPELRTRLLINSRTDVAIVVGADGVHLRSDDISPTETRAVWNKAGSRASTREPLIGISCHTPEDVREAEHNGADFAVFAPVFEKKSATPAGLSPLREACRAKIPVLALGGVALDNARSCLDAGAGGIAAIRLFQENRIAELVKKLR